MNKSLNGDDDGADLPLFRNKTDKENTRKAIKTTDFTDFTLENHLHYTMMIAGQSQ